MNKVEDVDSIVAWMEYGTMASKNEKINDDDGVIRAERSERELCQEIFKKHIYLCVCLSHYFCYF